MARKINRLLKSVSTYVDGSDDKWLRTTKFDGTVIVNPVPYPPIPSGSYSYDNVNGTMPKLDTSYDEYKYDSSNGNYFRFKVVAVSENNCYGDVSAYPRVANHNDMVKLCDGWRYATYPKLQVGHLYGSDEYWIDDTTGFRHCMVVTDYNTMSVTDTVTDDKDTIIRDIVYDYATNLGGVELNVYNETWDDFIANNLSGYVRCVDYVRRVPYLYYEYRHKDNSSTPKTLGVIIKRVHMFTRTIEDILDFTLELDESNCANNPTGVNIIDDGMYSFIGLNDIHDTLHHYDIVDDNRAYGLPYGYVYGIWAVYGCAGNSTSYHGKFFDMNINNGTIVETTDACNCSQAKSGLLFEDFLSTYHTLWYPRGRVGYVATIVSNHWYYKSYLYIYDYVNDSTTRYPIPNEVIPTIDIDVASIRDMDVIYQDSNYVYMRLGYSTDTSTSTVTPDIIHKSRLNYKWYGEIVKFDKSTYEFETIFVPIYSYLFKIIFSTMSKWLEKFRMDDTYTYHIVGNKCVRIHVGNVIDTYNVSTTKLNGSIIGDNYYPDNITAIDHVCDMYVTPSTPTANNDYEIYIRNISFIYNHYNISKTDSTFTNIIDTATDNSNYLDNNDIGTYYYIVKFYNSSGNEIFLDDENDGRKIITIQ